MQIYDTLLPETLANRVFFSGTNTCESSALERVSDHELPSGSIQMFFRRSSR